jgi:succinate dehydrogenase / fumarate reductase, cytochrome b subunit
VSAPASTASSPAQDATLFSSTIGRKAVMAATGLVLYGFVVAHLVGNLQVYMGPEAINAYGKFLHEFLHG